MTVTTALILHPLVARERLTESKSRRRWAEGYGTGAADSCETWARAVRTLVRRMPGEAQALLIREATRMAAEDLSDVRRVPLTSIEELHDFVDDLVATGKHKAGDTVVAMLERWVGERL